MALNNYNQDPFDQEDFQKEYPPEPERNPATAPFSR